VAHDPSSLSKLFVQKLGSYFKAIAHVLIFPSFWYWSDEPGTKMHDRLAKLLVWDFGASNLDRQLGSCAI